MNINSGRIIKMRSCQTTNSRHGDMYTAKNRDDRNPTHGGERYWPNQQSRPASRNHLTYCNIHIVV